MFQEIVDISKEQERCYNEALRNAGCNDVSHRQEVIDKNLKSAARKI